MYNSTLFLLKSEFNPIFHRTVLALEVSFVSEA